MYFDTHVHSKISTDSQMAPCDAINRAQGLGMGVIFTEHIDLDYIKNDWDFRFDCADYLNRYAVYRKNSVLLGVEIGMTHMSSAENRAIADGYDFDYVIGSVHMVEDRDIFIDYFEQEKTPQEFYGEYLHYVLRMVEENDFFHSLGHIDYISRYSPLKEKELLYVDYKKLYDKIIGVLLDKNKLMELNTRRLSTPGAYENLRRIYRRYRELGGKYVTVGSDAHVKEDVGKLFSQAMTLLKETDLQPAYFSSRKMISFDI